MPDDRADTYGDLAPYPDWMAGAQATPAPSWNAALGMPSVPPPIVPPRPDTGEKTIPRFVAEAVIPSMIAAPFQLAGGPGRAYRGEMSPEEMYSWGPAMALNMMGAGTSFAGPGLGVFGGRGARTANLDLLAKAEGMHAAGAAPESIWGQTGWFRGADGQWRFEIPDVNARLSPLTPEEIERAKGGAVGVGSAAREGVLSNVLEHPELYEAYPQLGKGTTADVLVSGHEPAGSVSGYYDPSGPYINVLAGDEAAARSALLHEAQHGVQAIEGFAPGGSVRNLGPVTPRQLQGLARRTAQAEGLDWGSLSPAARIQYEGKVRFRLYEKLAGETEARTVQARADQEHLGPPWLSEDVAREQQIIPRPLTAPASRLRRPFAPGVQALEKPPVPGELAPVELGAFPTTSPRRILAKTKEGGYSVRLPTGERPSEGLMVGMYGNEDPRNLVIAGREPTLADVRQHAETNLEALQKPERYYGTWLDQPAGTTYFDVSQRFPAEELRKATKFGERTGQLSGYDVGLGQTFPIGNWEQFVQGPEFLARMNQMAGEGRQYLSQFPTKEWWDMHGGPFERVYGTERMPQTAGFTASTAPNAAPRENLQTMSEYMRRYIKGEPTIQPEWRVPEGAMSRQAGSKIGMEASREANLEKAARGDLQALSADKVRNEALAMMGDPNAVVLDRHWARLGDAPEQGIYTMTEPGVIKGRPYELMADAVRSAARAAGRDPRDFSADAWTGIRKTIQETGELFGQKFKGASIRGESKSYADHFEDLIREKAAHLKIGVQEMEKRLRNGDAELLSIMLGAPTIAAAYRYWDAGQNAGASNANNRATELSQ